MTDEECICKGNWRFIVKECQHLIGKEFKDKRGDKFIFFGVVHGDDDYYYGMIPTGEGPGLRLLSCVGNLKTHGFELS